MSLTSPGGVHGSRAQQDFQRPVEVTASSFLNTDRSAQGRTPRPNLKRGNSSAAEQGRAAAARPGQTDQHQQQHQQQQPGLLRSLVSFQSKDSESQAQRDAKRAHHRSQSLQARSVVEDKSYTQMSASAYSTASDTHSRGRRSSFHKSNDMPSFNNGNMKESRRDADPGVSQNEGPRTGGSGFSGDFAQSNQGSSQQTPSTNTQQQAAAQSANLSGLVCNVHRTTGQEPRALVGASTTVLGDTLYVFGGRMLSRSRPLLTADLYALDLIKRHWRKVETKGDIPPPRYFHSMCALGDSHLVCYGGMSPTVQQSGASLEDQAPEVVVMSDIHIYDASTRTWRFIPARNTPQGRYAHCAAILPSSAAFASQSAPLSALQHNVSNDMNPNSGSIGITIDGAGGAEMVIVGGQDSSNHYIEQISVFNLRSLRWSGTSTLGKSCGAYRSVVAGPIHMSASRIGKGDMLEGEEDESLSSQSPRSGSTMLIYSNYNFLDVRLELQIRSSDGTLTEKPMNSEYAPPGLRFPNGGVIDNHFVVSGTYLTSSKQEYALWALNLKTLEWSRIDAGPSVFSQGSWNRGVLWARRNTFVILGNRKRSLVDDYNHRRLNFTNVCTVELEAFGLYDNPRRASPTGKFKSMSAPKDSDPSLAAKDNAVPSWNGGGRPHFRAASELGKMAMGLRELADMDLLAVGGERIPVNSRIIARRWGPYFNDLLRESTSNAFNATRPLPLRGDSQFSQASSATITPSLNSNASTLVGQHRPPSPLSVMPMARPRTLYLPHTYLTIQSLVHYLYTSSLPPSNHPLSTPQVLCSLLQLARPYRIDGLIEAVVERLHQALDGRNAAAVFNAAAMAAGGGSSLGFGLGLPSSLAQDPTPNIARRGSAEILLDPSTTNNLQPPPLPVKNGMGGKLSINTAVANSGNAANHHHGHGRNPSTELPNSAASTVSTSTAGSDMNNHHYNKDGGMGSPSDPDGGANGENGEVDRNRWRGSVSAVVGLQKRGLRGLMEGRRLRERGRRGSDDQGVGGGPDMNGNGGPPVPGGRRPSEPGPGSVGLGIA